MLKHLEPAVFQQRFNIPFAARIEVIQAKDLILAVLLKQCPAKMRADEPGSACHKYVLHYFCSPFPCFFPSPFPKRILQVFLNAAPAKALMLSKL